MYLPLDLREGRLHLFLHFFRKTAAQVWLCDKCFGSYKVPPRIRSDLGRCIPHSKGLSESCHECGTRVVFHNLGVERLRVVAEIDEDPDFCGRLIVGCEPQNVGSGHVCRDMCEWRRGPELVQSYFADQLVRSLCLLENTQRTGRTNLLCEIDPFVDVGNVTRSGQGIMSFPVVELKTANVCSS